MQFSDTSTSQGLLQDVTFLTGMDTTAYATADRTRNMNRWYSRVISLIFKAQGLWEFDDTDKTDLPQATADLVNGQADYELPKSLTTNPTTLQGGVTGGAITKLLRVEVQDANGTWIKLKQIDQSDIPVALDEFMKTNGTPRYYDVRGNTLILYATPATGYVTLTAGLKIYFAREAYKFLAADTTREPGFAEMFHRILSLGASYDWFIKTHEFDKAQSMKLEIAEQERGLTEFYAGRNPSKNANIRRRVTSLI